MTDLAIESREAGAVLKVRATPGAPREGVTGVHGDGALKVSVRAAPERGKANEAVIDVLAEALGVRRGGLELVSGETSREKRVLFRGMTVEALRVQVAAALRE